MNWEKFFGHAMFERLKSYCGNRNMSLAAVVRMAVAKYIEEEV